MNERELIARAKDGDFDAFLTLIKSHQTKIYNLALKLTGNKHDAEDVVQDTLVKAIEKIDQFRGEAAFGTWLYSIALNESRGHLARQKHNDLKPLEDYLPTPAANGSHDHDAHLFDWQDPHQLLEQVELREIITAGLNELPPIYREAFVLRYLEELSIKEIAKLTSESTASIKSRVLRARLALRDYLSKSFEDRYGQQMPGLH